MLNSKLFQKRNRNVETAFIRERKLPFKTVLMIILANSLKSVQNRLNEFLEKMSKKFTTASAAAFTKARAKLAHTAFIELNREGIVRQLYEEVYKKYKGFRLLAVDGSQVNLPKEEEILKEFGPTEMRNPKTGEIGIYASSRVSVLYDVLNHVCIDAIMGNSKAYEVTLALEHLANIERNNLRLEKELLIFDRGYPSYYLFAKLISKGYDFVARCSKSSFKESQELFEHEIESKIATIKPVRDIKKNKKLHLPPKIKIRFVRVVLSTGEVEVLATSLLNEKQYSSAIFNELYHLRWGVETFYGIIKNRLNLENFSGKTVESVKQDFFATILITGLETILTADAQQEFDSRASTNQQPLHVNRSVSFNAIKNHVFNLFSQEEDIDLLLDKLTKLFLTQAVSVQQNRDSPRKPRFYSRILYFFRYKKKVVF